MPSRPRTPPRRPAPMPWVDAPPSSAATLRTDAEPRRRMSRPYQQENVHPNPHPIRAPKKKDEKTLPRTACRRGVDPVVVDRSLLTIQRPRQSRSPLWTPVGMWKTPSSFGGTGHTKRPGPHAPHRSAHESGRSLVRPAHRVGPGLPRRRHHLTAARAPAPTPRAHVCTGTPGPRSRAVPPPRRTARSATAPGFRGRPASPRPSRRLRRSPPPRPSP
jgi:hypothetical protein